MPAVGGMHIPFAVPECRIEHVVERDPDLVVVQLRRCGASGRCPDYGGTSYLVTGTMDDPGPPMTQSR